jgi:radical SAM superfamily enzyme YgiQ (UPF0313 family)
LNVEKLSDEDLAWADYAFISAMVVQRKSARQTIARCKNAGLKVVAGGPLFTSEYERFDEVDHFVLNEAELTLPAFPADYNHGNVQRIYTTPEYADIQQTPIPMWELINLKRYALMSIQFSRGCPFNWTSSACGIASLYPYLKSDRIPQIQNPQSEF